MSVKTLFKDADYLVLAKPAGQLLDRPFFRTFFSEDPPLAISPLPAAVGGVALFARHATALEYAQDRIKNGTFWRRNFQVIVQGKLDVKDRSGCLRIPLKKRGKFYHPDPQGVVASTTWKFLKWSKHENLALLEMEPSGATPAVYQIRAHALFGLKAPVVGDPKNLEISGNLMVYCQSMKFPTFGGSVVKVSAAPPEAMIDFFKIRGWVVPQDSEIFEEIVEPGNFKEKPGNTKVERKEDLFAQLR